MDAWTLSKPLLAVVAAECIYRGLQFDNKLNVAFGFIGACSSVFVGADLALAFVLFRVFGLHRSQIDENEFRRRNFANDLGVGIAFSYWYGFLRFFDDAETPPDVFKIIVVPKKCEMAEDLDDFDGIIKASPAETVKVYFKEHFRHGRNLHPIDKDVYEATTRSGKSVKFAWNFPRTLQSSLGRGRVPIEALNKAREDFLCKTKLLLKNNRNSVAILEEEEDEANLASAIVDLLSYNKAQ